MGSDRADRSSQRQDRLAAYRAGRGRPRVGGKLLANCAGPAPLWTEPERLEFRDVMAEAWDKVQVFTGDVRTKKFRQYSPFTCDMPEEWAARYLTDEERELTRS